MKKFLLALLVLSTLVGCSKYDFSSKAKSDASIEIQAEKENIDPDLAIEIVNDYIDYLSNNDEKAKKAVEEFVKEQKKEKRALKREQEKKAGKLASKFVGNKSIKEIKAFMESKGKKYEE